MQAPLLVRCLTLHALLIVEDDMQGAYSSCLCPHSSAYCCPHSSAYIMTDAPYFLINNAFVHPITSIVASTSCSVGHDNRCTAHLCIVAVATAFTNPADEGHGVLFHVYHHARYHVTHSSHSTLMFFPHGHCNALLIDVARDLCNPACYAMLC